MNEFEENFDELPEEPLELDDIGSEDDETPAKRELLTIRLFKKAIKEAEGNKDQHPETGNRRNEDGPVTKIGAYLRADSLSTFECGVTSKEILIE